MLTPFQLGWMCFEMGGSKYVFKRECALEWCNSSQFPILAIDVMVGFLSGLSCYREVHSPLPTIKNTTFLVADHETVLALPKEDQELLFRTLREAYCKSQALDTSIMQSKVGSVLNTEID